jgi:hypothetical protein
MTSPVSALFALTLALSAALLFSLQPLVARMGLPILGGTPAVWNTCMVFFQSAVLAGYGLAHLLATRVCPKPQTGIFLLLILIGGLGLPVVLADARTPAPDQPLLWLLGRLAFKAGPPALALAVASPLLQRWFTRTDPSGREPYFLYTASNLGSLGALLAYPLVLEPIGSVSQLALLWSAGYALWALAILACATLLFRALRTQEAGTQSGIQPPPPSASVSQLPTPHSPLPPLRWTWIALGAIPASLLQGCTLFLTTDVASIPLLWVVPLALYLLTFVLAFSPRGARLLPAANRLLPFLATALLFVILGRFTQPVGWLVGFHLAYLTLAGLVCHGRLVALRPAPEHLTSFYFALSIGGVLGGAFNSLVAPHLFRSVAEYPIAIALACAALPLRAGKTRGHWVSDLAAALAAGVGLAVFGLVFPWLTEASARLRDALVFGIPAIVCCTFLDRPRRLALGLLAVFLAGFWIQHLWTGTRVAERNFFGISRVTRDAEGRFHQLVHGNTVHGRQFLAPNRRGEPLTYYHPHGPLGGVFGELQSRPAPEPRLGPRRIAVIGLGIGSSAAYARPGEDWTFYEIDPAVIRIAQDTNWFTFLADCRADRWRIVEGDARLRLASEPDQSFDLILLDAFSSDAIPVHLLTSEAMVLYFAKLRPGGFIAAHISNRYLALEPVFAAHARDFGLACRSADDTHDDPETGKESSHWVVLARTPRDLGRLTRQAPWVPAEGSGRVSPWTDQRAGVMDVFEWR